MTRDTLLIITAAVYMAAVYLFPVKRGKQKLVPWIICTGLQLASVLYFGRLTALIGKFFSVEGVVSINHRYYPYICAACLLILNTAAILTVNSISVSMEKKKAKQEEEARRASMTREQLEDEEKAEQLQMDIAKAAISINSANDEDQGGKRTGMRRKGRG